MPLFKTLIYNDYLQKTANKPGSTHNYGANDATLHHVESIV